ncbi:hypothetical protein CCAX7_24070 [Capsulimonas corticalis]|uniref:Uncharacterized protein n=1 Tax=Capsulimonas corticalis TaxID=2219043 RepID=A0A402CV87_9BACT|nr:hypothetical protein [Capsulimonas corticalis]BDI30356.1 hypothetical protein CCAX7_24070 [Capsulimonas corticalis]
MIIISHKFGQLGNRLCLFAHFIAVGREHGIAVANLAFDEYADLFETTSADIACRFPARRLRLPVTPRLRRALHRISLAADSRIQGPVKVFAEKVSLPEGQSMDIGSPDFVAKARRKIVCIEGWEFRSADNVKKHADAIRAYFRPVAAREADVQQVLAKGRKDADVLVGVHVRHGDYQEFCGGRYYYTLEQYDAVMRRVQELFPAKRVGFLLCSNLPQDLSTLPSVPVTSGPGNMVSDMYALAGCDYILGAPSTYTTWASFYGDVPLYKILDPDAPISLSDFQRYLPN